MMRRPRLFPLLAALALIVSSLACGLGANETVPVPSQAPGEPFSSPPPAIAIPTSTRVQPGPALPDENQPTLPAPAIPERRRLTLEFPPVIRAGDADLIRLTLEMDELGNLTPTAQIEGNQVIGEVVEIPNLYETHHVTAEARLDLAGVEVIPPGTISSPLLPGQSVTFFWSVSPREAGSFRGTLWLHLRFVDKASGEESRRAVSAQTIEIEGANLFGFSGNSARTLGVIGSVVGAVTGFPFLQDILKFLWKRRKK
ncbi:MAG: hypothetical protein ACOY0R_21515 [Chloroflexota bacterium]